MTGSIWLASYPKSGNTWFRVLHASLGREDDQPVDINDLPERGGIASARGPFDHEIDCLRPRVYEELARGAEDDLESPSAPEIRLVKVHDAYLPTPLGEPLLAGARGAEGAIVMVRDPRDVAPSLANHNQSTIDEAISFMSDPAAGFCTSRRRQASQLRQKLPGWSGHVESWLDQRDIPVHLVRYEDLKADTAAVLQGAMGFAGRVVTRDQLARAVRLADFSQLQGQERGKGFREWRDRPREGELFFRRGEAGGWRDELTPEQVARLEAAHAPMMARLGYELSAPETRLEIEETKGR